MECELWFYFAKRHFSGFNYGHGSRVTNNFLTFLCYPFLIRDAWCVNKRLVLFLEDVVNQLKCLFALRVAQDISSLEKYGSILLQFNRNGLELPSTHKLCHEIAHVSKQGFENFWLLIPLYCLMNLCLQLLPSWRLTRAGCLFVQSRALIGEGVARNSSLQFVWMTQFLIKTFYWYFRLTTVARFDNAANFLRH